MTSNMYDLSGQAALSTKGNHVTVKVLNSYKITNLRRRDEFK